MNLDELLRGEAAAGTHRALQRYALERQRNGAPLPWAQEVLDELFEAAGRPPHLHGAAGSASGTSLGTVGLARPTPGVPVREAARMTGLSESYVKRLCRDKQVVASRPGRDWLVDMDSLRSVTGRTAA